jgi:predicted HTH transcriptional regulator
MLVIKLTKNEDSAKLDLIAKLLYMQTRPRIEGLKSKLLTTEKHKKIYSTLNGERTTKEVAQASNCSVRLVKGLLPEWESKGLILSIGKSKAKKYVNIENLEV